MPQNLLFTPVTLGAFKLTQRVVMLAPGLASPAGVPSPDMAAAYCQHTSPGGLLISEPTAVTLDGLAQHPGPALTNAEQVNQWRSVTAAVHQRGGWVVAQLSHVLGDHFASAPVHAAHPFDVAAGECLLHAYRNAAENALDAGFDGVELQAGDGAFAEFALCLAADATPALAWLADLVRTLCGICCHDRVGVSLSPARPDPAWAHMPWPTLAPRYAALLQELQQQRLAYVRLSRSGWMGSNDVAEGSDVGTALRRYFAGPMILSGGYNHALAEEDLRLHRAEAIGFGATPPP